jgi:pyrrolidone-carboxylate peptidase
MIKDDMDLRMSDDAGHYLCDFIYYSSLAYLYKAQRPRKVLFLHVPAMGTDEFIQRGTDLVVNLIRAIVESETEAKTKTKAPRGGQEVLERQEGAPGADGQE